MRVGIIGAGRLGRVLAQRWGGLGHEVYLGCRAEGVDAAALRSELGPVEVLPPHDAAGADIVVLAVPGAVASDVVASLGDLEGRVLIDCTNPDAPVLPSIGERVAAQALNGRVIKALNTLDARVLAEPRLADLRPAMPLCGDDPDARETVAELVWELGLAPVSFGDLGAAAMLESVALLRRRLGVAGETLAFSLVEVERELEERMFAGRQTRPTRRPVR